MAFYTLKKMIKCYTPEDSRIEIKDFLKATVVIEWCSCYV